MHTSTEYGPSWPLKTSNSMMLHRSCKAVIHKRRTQTAHNTQCDNVPHSQGGHTLAAHTACSADQQAIKCTVPFLKCTVPFQRSSKLALASASGCGASGCGARASATPCIRDQPSVGLKHHPRARLRRLASPLLHNLTPGMRKHVCISAGVSPDSSDHRPLQMMQLLNVLS